MKYVSTSLRELRDTADPHNIDPEAYFRLVLLARGVAVARPNHLVKYSAPTPPKPDQSKCQKIVIEIQCVMHHVGDIDAPFLTILIIAVRL